MKEFISNDIDYLINIYEKILEQYEKTQNRYEMSDYSKGVVSTYENVILDLKQLKLNNIGNVED